MVPFLESASPSFICTQFRTGEDPTSEDGSIANLSSGLGVLPAGFSSRPKITPEEDSQMIEITRGTSLLLAARERVLSLSEQRVCFTKLAAWTQGVK